MTHLNLSTGAGLVSAMTLVASVFVILYLVNYAVILYYQHRANRIRSDWWISSIFYVGVGLLAIANILNGLHACIAGFCFENLFDAFLLVAFILFIYGFRKRAEYSDRVGAEVEKFREHMKHHRDKK